MLALQYGSNVVYIIRNTYGEHLHCNKVTLRCYGGICLGMVRQKMRTVQYIAIQDNPQVVEENLAGRVRFSSTAII